MKKEKLVILGGGESGVGAALLGKEKGYEVFLSDSSKLKSALRAELLSTGISFEEEGHTLDLLRDADVLIKSPGIPDKVEIVQRLVQIGKSPISEIEFASWFVPEVPVVAITGSNGKTTTTSLIYEILVAAGGNVGLGGNIGKSFARLLLEEPKDAYVLELSSFQLDGIDDFQPDVAVITNVTPDHLDRYEYKMENYLESKFRIALNQNSEDWLILCDDDEMTKLYLRGNKMNANEIFFSQGPDPKREGGFRRFSELILRHQGKQVILHTAKMNLRGMHNHYNVMASALAALVIGVEPEVIEKAVYSFSALAHRMEEVGQIDGVTYINDSKATNVDSVWYALDAVEGPVIWLLGGVDKGNNYQDLMGIAVDRVKAIIAIGAENEKILEAFQGHIPQILEIQSMPEVVEAASKLAISGDTVLLSPACASFDFYRNYIDRGDQFRMEVGKLSTSLK